MRGTLREQWGKYTERIQEMGRASQEEIDQETQKGKEANENPEHHEITTTESAAEREREVDESAAEKLGHTRTGKKPREVSIIKEDSSSEESGAWGGCKKDR